jgi:aryl-alcohol dehydrogenase-like predicted oxidoreductase
LIGDQSCLAEMNKAFKSVSARKVPRAQVALAWIVQKPFVTAPIIGASKSQHFEDAIAALTLKLDAGEIEQLESAYTPHSISGHS